MTTSGEHRRKLGILEWLLIAYVLTGGIWAVAALSTSGDRFAGFVVYGLYAMPSTLLVSATGLGDTLFSDWPTAVYWTAALVVVNGLMIYAVAKTIASSWRRRVSLSKVALHDEKDEQGYPPRQQRR